MFSLEHGQDEGLSNCKRFAMAMKTAANQSFLRRHKVIAKPYLSDKTWQLIKDRQTARNNGRMEEEKALNREVTKQARKDKQMWKVERLQDLSDVKEAWRNIRYEKKPFIPNFYSMKDIHGKRVPMNEKAHALAEYLYERQWAPKHNPSHVDPHRRKIIDKDLNIPTSEFSYTEVQEAIRKLRTNKAPGPDGVINELFQYLDLENIQQLTRCLNILWNKKTCT